MHSSAKSVSGPWVVHVIQLLLLFSSFLSIICMQHWYCFQKSDMNLLYLDVSSLLPPPPPPPIIIVSVAVTLAGVVSSYFVWGLFSVRVIRIPVCMAVYPQVWCVICCVDFCRCISYPYLKLLVYFIYIFFFFCVCVFVCTCWWHIALLLSCLYLHLFFCGLNGLDVAHKLLTILFGI